LPYWVYFQLWKWVVAALVVFLISGSHIGYANTWEILVGRKSPIGVAWPWVAWPVSIFGWLLVPALVGGVAGFVITAQLQGRRSKTIDDIKRPSNTAGEAGPTTHK
jgi:hypothetical protein